MYDFKTVCRTCSSDGELQSLFNDDQLKIADMLTEIVDIKVIENDHYPQNICSICLDKLNSAYNFKKQCQDIHKKYQEYIDNLDIKNEITVDTIKEENYFIAHEDDNDDYNYDNNPLQAENIRKKCVRRKKTCKICNQNVTKLYEHMRSHTKEKPYKCEQCQQGFSLSSNYKRHLRTHTGEKPHVCTICERSFTRKSALKEHIHVHEIFSSDKSLTADQVYREKSFLCNYCGKGFVQRTALLSHIKVHTGERPYKCTLCEKSFSQMSALNTHQLTHTGEKPYKCLYCEKQFSHRGTCISHQLIHTGDKPYKCDICNQCFRQHHHLKVHSRTHSGDKPHTCHVCEKQFSLKSNLTVHIRTHTGETPYVCSICCKGFYDSSSLKKHRKRHLFADNDNDSKMKSFDLLQVKLIEK